MQGKFLNLTTGYRQLWTYFLKATLTVVMIWFVGSRILEEGESLSWNFDGRETAFLMLVLALLPFNLGLEALKWQVLQVGLLPDFSFRRAFKGVLIGACLGLFTPNRIGDYMGRLMVVPKKHRWESGSFILINRLSQMLITLVLGIVAFQLALGLEIVQLSDTWAGFIRLVSIVLLAGLLLFFTLKSVLISGVKAIFPGVEALKRVLPSLNSVDNGLLFRVCGYSLLRYLVFSTQYLLLLYAFGAEGSLEEMILLVLMVFLIKSLAPIASLAELGIREAVAVMVGGWLGVSGIVATTTAFSLYLVNLVFPAGIGLLLIYWEKYE